MKIKKMKRLKIKITVLLILGSFSFINCSKEKNQEPDPVKLINLDTLSFSHSMKGWELYSWPNGNDWNYSILAGTNRLKTYDEVITNKIVVFGVDSLKMLLDKLPVNEEIFWISEGWLESIWGSGYGNLSLPDNNTINEIKNYCSQKELVLSISF
jgi:hypothetical protein